MQVQSQAIKLSTNLIADAKKRADVEMRSVPKQIEYIYNIGKIALENPDLPISFIIDVLKAKNEPSTPFEFLV